MYIPLDNEKVPLDNEKDVKSFPSQVKSDSDIPLLFWCIYSLFEM